MQITRTSSAEWKGSGKTGNGTLTTPSGALRDTAYSYPTRFEDKPGTNPEELIGAAHAGCFSMKLAFVLQAAGIEAERIHTEATVVLENGSIPSIHLRTRVWASGLTASKLAELATDAKTNCPVSKLFNASISLEATLEID
ncbi:MAG: OsmC family peroxiredoxin [Saprospiraceae bacterium]|nr:OsmC family peroxiredoxin [Saprospiraceae bacterium]